MNKLRVFTSFSGYDSQCLALDRLAADNAQFNYELVGWSEIDKYAIQAHNALYPQYVDRNFGDISKIDWAQVPDFDLFTYSSPCQDFSQAGLQRGGEQGSGTRSSLLWECRRAIIAKKPKYLLMENVSALVSKKFIKLFNQWQLELQGYGYKNFAKVLNAKDYGVPQNRERIFLVSILDDEASYEFPQPFTLEKRLKDVLEQNVDERYYLSDERIAGLLASMAKEKEAGRGYEFAPKTEADTTANSVTTNAGGRKTDKFIAEPRVEVLGDLDETNKWQGKVIRQDNQVISTEGLSKAIPATHGQHPFKIAEPCVQQVGNIVSTGNFDNPQRGRIYSDEGVSPALNTETGGGFRPKIATCAMQGQNFVKEQILLNGTSGDVASTITTAHHYSGNIVSPKRGQKKMGVMEIEPTIIEDFYITKRPARTFTETSPTLRSERVELKCTTNGIRVRKLTERELFRLMDVSEPDIDILLNAGISKTQLAKMAGNSIVVNVLYHIFDRMFIHTEPTEAQLLLF